MGMILILVYCSVFSIWQILTFICIYIYVCVHDFEYMSRCVAIVLCCAAATQIKFFFFILFICSASLLCVVFFSSSSSSSFFYHLYYHYLVPAMQQWKQKQNRVQLIYSLKYINVIHYFSFCFSFTCKNINPQCVNSPLIISLSKFNYKFDCNEFVNEF